VLWQLGSETGSDKTGSDKTFILMRSLYLPTRHEKFTAARRSQVKVTMTVEYRARNGWTKFGEECLEIKG
jgi:uncharacterized membrane protein